MEFYENITIGHMTVQSYSISLPRRALRSISRSLQPTLHRLYLYIQVIYMQVQQFLGWEMLLYYCIYIRAFTVINKLIAALVFVL